MATPARAVRYASRMSNVRHAAVAGLFYPGKAHELAATVDALLAGAELRDRRPKALVVPHAGYEYSGAIAASAFAQIVPIAKQLERVVLLGPAHREYVVGIASVGAAELETPLGRLAVDDGALARIEHAPNARAHAFEHSLEVMLPFLQRIAPHVTVVPLLASEADPTVVGGAIAALWGGPETLIVISSDLSHYLPYDRARTRDAETALHIVRGELVDSDRACGAVAINGLTRAARQQRLAPELLDLRSSGDTAGDRDRVVGYGAFAYYPAA